MVLKIYQIYNFFLLINLNLALFSDLHINTYLCQYFSHDLETASQQRMYRGNSLHRALEREEFEVYYQLQADMTGTAIVGSEALLRWHHPKEGLITPAGFLDILEETGLILSVSQWLWSQVFRQHKSWMDQGLISIHAHGERPRKQTNAMDEALSREGTLERKGKPHPGGLHAHLFAHDTGGDIPAASQGLSCHAGQHTEGSPKRETGRHRWRQPHAREGCQADRGHSHFP